jgi:hypothetical protein
MGRRYKCTCDNCELEITSPNDENDLVLNSGKYVYCESCYQELLSWWECWGLGTWTLVKIKDNE